MMKAMRWVVLNGVIFTMLWLGLVEGMRGPRNVGLFAVWAGSLFVLAAGTRADWAEKLAALPEWPCVPGWLDASYDLTVLVLLVWHGRWVAGSAWLVQTMLCVGMHAKVMEIRRQGAAAGTEPGKGRVNTPGRTGENDNDNGNVAAECTT